MPKKRKSGSHDTRQERRDTRRNNKRSWEERPPEFDEKPVSRVKPRNGEVQPLTEAQACYDDAMRAKKIIIGIGPAGTGKTWLAATRAAEALDRGEIDHIYVTRPVVGAEAEEEKLGALPGDLMTKYEPYLRPVREALEEHFGSGKLEYLLRHKIIEPRPMAFLRGATLKNCWVLADEMQNATKGQLKMLLTRFGESAKFLISGDPKQCDLSNGRSGLMDAVERLNHIKAVETIRFTTGDIVREGIVQEIVEAYEG